VECDTITYNALLNAAANAFGSPQLKQESVDIGQRAFAALQADDDCSATSLTYSYYFKMVRRLVSQQEQFQMVKNAFDLCCEQGCLNHIVWKQVWQMVQGRDDEQKLLLGEHYNSSGKMPHVSKLPAEWSRHSMSDRRLPREISNAMGQ